MAHPLGCFPAGDKTGLQLFTQNLPLGKCQNIHHQCKISCDIIQKSKFYQFS